MRIESAEFALRLCTAASTPSSGNAARPDAAASTPSSEVAATVITNEIFRYRA